MAEMEGAGSAAGGPTGGGSTGRGADSTEGGRRGGGIGAVSIGDIEGRGLQSAISGALSETGTGTQAGESSAFGKFLDKAIAKVTSPEVQQKAVGAGIGALAGSLIGVGPVLGAKVGSGLAGLISGGFNVSPEEVIGGGIGALAGRAVGAGPVLGAKIGKGIGGFFTDEEKGSKEPGTAGVAGVSMPAGEAVAAAPPVTAQRGISGIELGGRGSGQPQPQQPVARASGLPTPQPTPPIFPPQQVAQARQPIQPQPGGLNLQGGLPLVNLGAPTQASPFGVFA